MKKILFICAIVLSLCSCQTKQSAINDLRNLNREMQVYGNSYSLNDWKDAGERYYKINKRIKGHLSDYSDADIKEISELNGSCLRSFTEGAVTKVQGAASALKSLVEGFLLK